MSRLLGSGQGSLESRFLGFVSLNVLGMVGLSCYILADTYFIANGVGAEGLAALNFAIVAYTLMQAMGLMVGIGSATQYQVRLSAGDREGASRAYSSAWALALAAAAICLVIGVGFAEEVARAVGADDATFGLTCEYLRTVFSFAPFFLANNVMLPFVRNDSSPQRAMAAMLAGSIGNIILDWVFIYAFGWGMFGAAFATGLAPIMSMAVLLPRLLRRREAFDFNVRLVSVKTALRSLSLGVSSFVVEITSGVVLFVFNLVILHFEGTVGVAAYGVVANLAFVATALFVGVAQGIQPLASEAFGRSDGAGLLKVAHMAVLFALALAALCTVLTFVFAEPLAAAFNRDGDLRLASLATEGIRLYFFGYLFAGFNIVMAAFFSAVMKPAFGMAVTVCRGFVAMFACLVPLVSLFGMVGVWLAFPAAEALTACLALAFLAKTARSLRCLGRAERGANDES